MKSYIKYIIVAIILLVLFAIIYKSNRPEKYNEGGNSPTTIENTTTVKEKGKDNKQEETTVVDVETVYHENVAIDQFIAGYNKKAEIEITPDMVSKGVYDGNANIVVDDISIIIYDTPSSISVDYSYEGKSDEVIYPFFRDFSKIMKSTLKNKQIEKAWREIKDGNYTDTSFYSMKGIEVTYITGDGDNDNNHYIIRTMLNKKE